MALIKCSECGKEISDKAIACPYCGCPIETNSAKPEVTISKDEQVEGTCTVKRRKPIVGILVVLFLAAGIVFGSKVSNNRRFEKCAYATVTALQEILKNPESLFVYDVEFYVSTIETDKNERNTITDSKHPIVIMHYTAQNSYGGNTTGYVISTYHKGSARYEIDGYTYTMDTSEISENEKDADIKMLTIKLIKLCRKNNKKIGSLNVKKLNRHIKNT